MALKPLRSLDPLPRFSRALLDGGLRPSDKILVACSGGPDSMALLDLASRSGLDVVVGHVDHGLRPSSGADARFVRAQAAARGRPCFVAHAPVRARAARRGRGLEDAARELRYAALGRMARRTGCVAVLAAHTLDDQAETVVMNLLRGAGPGGLAGMSPRSPLPGRPDLVLVRPLLDFPKRSLRTHLRTRGVPFRVDETNAQPLFLRNRLRPVLARWEKERPGFFERVARTARVLRDEEDFWRRRLGMDRRKQPPRRLDRRDFMRYHMAEQRRRLRLLFGLTHFESLERVRQFAADRAAGPLDLPEGRVAKTARFLIFKRKIARENP
ncbi:MAG: tRNA lysidine(34) synthetase TilS [Elusimicrobia bacterium]|nr:tRNA lysidine(34) synthetase TilS [Elusimicrobiota bacterium]MBK7689399.1 tRNA lysidine(34) synthetase TilS [Elusimicrobiota bacterium]MBK8422754.1 tRNA lysidine(34) synthetase TilS [Elusimicrobiota bacterium]MBK9694256.1 tRNA lysidine(34) synthetase TilS [Elusimicrobiota bacterium]MBL0360269.1 tRNA lysidine(34) synthetase TilS [Elusimicrobiota bacterium]